MLVDPAVLKAHRRRHQFPRTRPCPHLGNGAEPGGVSSTSRLIAVSALRRHRVANGWELTRPTAAWRRRPRGRRTERTFTPWRLSGRPRRYSRTIEDLRRYRPGKIVERELKGGNAREHPCGAGAIRIACDVLPQNGGWGFLPGYDTQTFSVVAIRGSTRTCLLKRLWDSNVEAAVARTRSPQSIAGAGDPSAARRGLQDGLRSRRTCSGAFLSRFRRVIAPLKAAAYQVIWHSDGNIMEVLATPSRAVIRPNQAGLTLPPEWISAASGGSTASRSSWWERRTLTRPPVRHSGAGREDGAGLHPGGRAGGGISCNAATDRLWPDCRWRTCSHIWTRRIPSGRYPIR